MSFTFMSFTFTIGNTSSETLLSFMSFTYTSFTLPQFTFCFVGNITQYCLSLYLANTSSGTILSFCLVGNIIQYCLSLYLANTNSGTILSFMYFILSILSMGTLVVEPFYSSVSLGTLVV